jgi:hypothetical protein
VKTSRTKTARPAGARVRVRLSNLFDEFDARKGELPKSRIRCVSVDAVADSEPVWSVVPRRIARQLGLRVHRAWNGWQTDGVTFKLAGRSTSESALVGGRHILIGRTVLMGTDLVIDASRAGVIPNPKHPDGPVFWV